MKNLIVFILISVSSFYTKSFSCSFSPYNEEYRFCFFKPKLFDYHTYNGFTYSASAFSPTEPYNEKDSLPNILLWFNYCKGKVPYKAIYQAIYELNVIDIDSSSSNLLIKYFYDNKNFEAIKYLTFAKNCESLNMFFEDPWEKFDYFNPEVRKKYIEKAYSLSKQTRSKFFKLRYTFLSIRLCYYNKDYKRINSLYNEVFKIEKSKDIIYYWSMHFNALAETDSALATYYAAQVFANAPDKRWAIHEMYYSNIQISKVLNFATNNIERANVYLFIAKHKVDKALEYIKEMYMLNPKYEGLSFLLIREINKIEDWVYTPYYSLLNPSIYSYNSDEEFNIKSITNRIEMDRLYANEVLDFVVSIDLKLLENKLVWESAEAQLLLITKQFSRCLQKVNYLERKITSKDSLLYQELQIIKAICLTSNQESGKAYILEEVKPTLLFNCNYKKFVFAIGRELEYKGNKTDAVLLFSCLNNGSQYDGDDLNNESNSMYWQSVRVNPDSYYGYYSEYFEYINHTYIPEELEDLIQAIEQNKKTDQFSSWKFSVLRNELQRLYDLLGTKYIRVNNLDKALNSFSKVDQNYWGMNYTSWEYNQNPTNIFDRNPFYTLKYTPAFIPIKDTIRITKLSLTKQLIKYLAQANNKTEKERAYYYFLVANCYFNMTQYGNAWMMRHYDWSSSGYRSYLEDDEEYFGCGLAKQYYFEAFNNAKTKKFKALCLRMIGLCEKRKLQFEFPYNWNGTSTEYDSIIFSKNKYYQDLKNKYPRYYEELTSDCSLFEKYFKDRR